MGTSNTAESMAPNLKEIFPCPKCKKNCKCPKRFKKIKKNLKRRKE